MTENKKLRAAVYVRQSVREDQGIRQQEADCREEIGRRGWILTENHIYRDNRTSASKHRDHRTGWGQMLAAYDRGDFDVLVATEPDRLARQVQDLAEITAPKRDMHIVTVRGGVDTGGGDDLLLGLSVMLGQREVRTKHGRAERYARDRRDGGHPAPGLPPYGYRHQRKPLTGPDTRKQHWVVQDDEAEVVRWLFAEFNRGTTIYDLVKSLNERGSRTSRGALWGTSTIRRMLINPAYSALLVPLGSARAGGNEKVELHDCTPGAWEPLVSQDDLIAARSRALAPERLTHDGTTSRKWLLPGLAWCSVCGGAVRSAKNKSLRGYRCAVGHFHREARPVDDYVVHELLQALSRTNLRVVNRDAAEQVERLRTALKAAKAQHREALALWRSGTITADELSAERLRLEAEMDRDQAALRDAVSVDPVVEALTSEDLATYWEELPLSRRRSLIEAMTERIEISPVGNGVRVRTHEQAASSVSITWRESSRRWSFDTGRVYEVIGGVPMGRRAEIADLLST